MGRVAVLLAVSAVLLLPGAGLADNPVLTGDVGAGDAFTIALTDASGARVTHLDPGTYTLVVHDRSDVHNFHLFGPGVNASTDVAAKGDFTFTVTLTDGVYRYVCDPHFTIMKGSFTVGAVPPAKLAASVGPGARIAVRGAAALTPGPAAITVADASRTNNFHLIGPGVNKATGVRFRGKVTWNVTLRTGKYVYRSDRNKKLSGSFSVA
jgi:hypothetical protein